MAVFEKTGKDIEYPKYPADKEKIDAHMCIEKEIMNDFNKIVAVYKAYGFDKTNKSELCSMLLTEFINSLEDNDEAILDLMGRMKNYRVRNKLLTHLVMVRDKPVSDKPFSPKDLEVLKRVELL